MGRLQEASDGTRIRGGERAQKMPLHCEPISEGIAVVTGSNIAQIPVSLLSGRHV